MRNNDGDGGISGVICGEHAGWQDVMFTACTVSVAALQNKVRQGKAKLTEQQRHRLFIFQRLVRFHFWEPAGSQQKCPSTPRDKIHYKCPARSALQCNKCVGTTEGGCSCGTSHMQRTIVLRRHTHYPAAIGRGECTTDIKIHFQVPRNVPKATRKYLQKLKLTYLALGLSQVRELRESLPKHSEISFEQACRMLTLLCLQDLCFMSQDFWFLIY